jgi:hypothetical protein
VCFLEGGLDEPKSTAPVGARFGKTHKGATRIDPSFVSALDAATRRILDDRRYVATGIFWMSADRFDRKFRSAEVPYRGIRATDGALYVRGNPGTQEFRASMANLSRLGADRAAQAILRKEVRGLALSLLDESGAMEVVSDVPMPMADQIALLAAMSEFVLADGPGTIPGNADLVRAAHLTGRIQKLIEADAKARGMAPVRSIIVDGILDAVWTNVDLGLYVPGPHVRNDATIHRAFDRIYAVPADLAGRCRRFTVAGAANMSVEMIRRMPNLTSVRVSTTVNDVPPKSAVEGLLSALLGLQHLEELVVDHMSTFDPSDWAVDPRFRLRRLKIASVPGSVLRVPPSVVDLDIGGEVSELRTMLASGVLPRVQRFRVEITGVSDLGSADADAIAAAFPNLTSLSVGGFVWRNKQFARRIPEVMPNLIHLSIPDTAEMTIEVIKGLVARPNPAMKDLRFEGMGNGFREYESVDTSDVPKLLATVPNVTRLELSALGFLALSRKYAGRPFDIVDIFHNTGTWPDFAMPPVRVLEVDGSDVARLTEIANVSHLPKAIIIKNPAARQRFAVFAAKYLGDAVALSTAAGIESQYLSEFIGSVLESAPQLQYLAFTVSDYQSTIAALARPKAAHRALTTVHVRVRDTMVGWVAEYLSGMLDPPDNLVITTIDTQYAYRPSELKNLAAKFPGTRTLCLPTFDAAAPRPGMPNPPKPPTSTELYPINVFTGDRSQLAWAKCDELTWFEDPWNPGFDNI